MPGHFICYSPTTSLEFALDLYNTAGVVAGVRAAAGEE